MDSTELWGDLGSAMRSLREANNRSLRQVEASSAWSRGTLSQVENAKARPSLALVRYYDAEFAGDGLLLSLFADAHALRLPVSPVTDTRSFRVAAGDRFEIGHRFPPTGATVTAGERLDATWVVRNSGTVAWKRRSLFRVGATAGNRLVSSSPRTPLPDLEPDGVIIAEVAVRAPMQAGTVVAHWAIVNDDATFCFPTSNLLSLTISVLG